MHHHSQVFELKLKNKNKTTYGHLCQLLEVDNLNLGKKEDRQQRWTSAFETNFADQMYMYFGFLKEKVGEFPLDFNTVKSFL